MEAGVTYRELAGSRLAPNYRVFDARFLRGVHRGPRRNGFVGRILHYVCLIDRLDFHLSMNNGLPPDPDPNLTITTRSTLVVFPLFLFFFFFFFFLPSSFHPRYVAAMQSHRRHRIIHQLQVNIRGQSSPCSISFSLSRSPTLLLFSRPPSALSLPFHHLFLLLALALVIRSCYRD